MHAYVYICEYARVCIHVYLRMSQYLFTYANVHFLCLYIRVSMYVPLLQPHAPASQPGGGGGRGERGEGEE